MGLISPVGENLLDFLELRQVLSTYDGDLRDPLWWPQESPVPMRVARGPFGIPLPSMPVPQILCGVSAGTCDSSTENNATGTNQGEGLQQGLEPTA